MKPSLRLLSFMLFAFNGIACSHVRPWERGRLAHPSMVNDNVGVAAEHVYAVQEGSIGGAAGSESGCGCN